jgi:hypothetical protein
MKVRVYNQNAWGSQSIVIRLHIDDKTGRYYVTGRQIKRVQSKVKANLSVVGVIPTGESKGNAYNICSEFKDALQSTLLMNNPDLHQGYLLPD